MNVDRMARQPRWPDLAWTIREAKIYGLGAAACAGGFSIIAGIAGVLTGNYMFSAAITAVLGLSVVGAVAISAYAERTPLMHEIRRDGLDL